MNNSNLIDDWSKVEYYWKTRFGRDIDLSAVLMMIGISEKGETNSKMSKEVKTDLISLGICKVLSLGGYYQADGIDSEGWPRYVAGPKHAELAIQSQEKLLMQYIIQYFKEEILPFD